MKYKVGDIVKIVKPAYNKNNADYNSLLGRVGIIIGYPKEDEREFEYKIKFTNIENNKRTDNSIDHSERFRIAQLKGFSQTYIPIIITMNNKIHINEMKIKNLEIFV